MKLDMDGQLYVVEEFQHVKRARGSAFVRTKLKNLGSGQSIKKVFQPSQKIKDAFIVKKNAQYLYKEREDFHFMDLETFEERIISERSLSEKANFLIENMEVILQLYEERVIGIEIPTFVGLKVKKASPGVKGNTVSTSTKLVVLESGYNLQVPLFIKEGDIIRIDTRSGEYVGKK